MIDIEKLHGLLAKATSLPWHTYKFCGHADSWYAESAIFGEEKPKIFGASKISGDNAALIVAAVNALPDLLSELEIKTNALGRQCDNMAFVLNKATLPDQWYSKFQNELEKDRDALKGGNRER